MQITTNFSLLELISSETAVRKGINNNPNQDVIDNLKRLFIKIVQPVRDWYKQPINITSAYRSPTLNKAIGGSATSDHCFGNAVDFTVPKEDYKKVFYYIKDNFEFDQLIWEFGDDNTPNWIHVSLRNVNRNQVLKAYKNVLGQTKYKPY